MDNNLILYSFNAIIQGEQNVSADLRGKGNFLGFYLMSWDILDIRT